jgi:hypothetical protein
LRRDTVPFFETTKGQTPARRPLGQAQLNVALSAICEFDLTKILRLPRMSAMRAARAALSGSGQRPLWAGSANCTDRCE